MTSSDVQQAIFAGNDIAMQWYALTHQTVVPGGPGTITVQTPPGGGLNATFGSGTLVLVGLGLIALVVLFHD